MADIPMLRKAPLLLILLLIVRASAGQPISDWVHPDSTGKLVYKSTPTGERIMDFSHAGYMGGGVALPTVAVKRTIKPSGGADDSTTIQAAIDGVAKLPLENGFRGTILLQPGAYNCPQPINLAASGVVLRGSGASGANCTTLHLTGRPHLAISARAPGRRSGDDADDAGDSGLRTSVTDGYVPSGAISFSVASAAGFSAGDTIQIRRPITDKWVHFMQMDDMTRDGRRQTWLKIGTFLTTERTIAAISGNKITLDVPISDSLDSSFTAPSGTLVFKLRPGTRLMQVGIESLHIEAPPAAINHEQPHFTAVRLSGQDCWLRNLVIDETMDSVSVNGRRITLTNVIVNRKAKHQGASKPAEFAPNGTQVLMDRCSVDADNVWFAATGKGVAGPVVLLNCTFKGDGAAESHQRWSTGILYDNVHVTGGSIECRNRGSMGSGHGWTVGWGVVWNCTAKSYIVQNPPGALNWLIGSIGKPQLAARPFGSSPDLPQGTIDSSQTPVTPKSLYLAQLRERLGAAALKNIGY